MRHPPQVLGRRTFGGKDFSSLTWITAIGPFQSSSNTQRADAGEAI